MYLRVVIARPVLNDEPDGLMRAVILVHAAHFWEVVHAQLGLEQDGLIVIDDRADIVHPPLAVGSVGMPFHDDVDAGRVRVDTLEHCWARQREIVVTAVGVVPARLRLGKWKVVPIGRFIIHGCPSCWLTVVGAAWVRAVCSKEIGALWRTNAIDKDISALANTDCDDSGVIRINRDKVVGDDLHDVAIDRNLQSCVCASVDDSQAVDLARGEVELSHRSRGARVLGLVNICAVVWVLAVDEHVLSVRVHRSIDQRWRDATQEVLVI